MIENAITDDFADDLEVCELCHTVAADWTGHGWFCEACRDRVVRDFRTGLLDRAKEHR